METREIKQVLEFEASAHDFYEAWMDEEQHSEFTEDIAKIDRREGGEFSIFSGSVHGRTLELIPDKKIVQEWRYDYPEWPVDHYSKITIQLKQEDGITKVRFMQTGIPAAYADEIDQGWKDYYWDPLHEYLE